MLNAADLAELLHRIRQRRHLSRGQVAKRLKLTSTVIYNIETGRTRIKLSYFVGLLRMVGHDPEKTLSRHLFSVKKLQSTAGAELVRSFRNRLQMSQRQLGTNLGYRGASIIHHFEKGIREPDLGDLFGLMALAHDNVRGLVQDLTNDPVFAAKFPEGREAVQEDWREYWSHFYISACRQIMRTSAYAAMPRYKPGYFADLLGVSLASERHALQVLAKFGLIRWENAKPQIVPGVRIVIPKDVPRALVDQWKVQWLEFGQRHYLQDQVGNALLTVDSLHVNKALFEQVVQRIRDLQDELHNLPLRDTDGLLQLSWLAAYVPV